MTRSSALRLASLLALGALVRSGYLVAPILDSDTAVPGLQARHVLQGEFDAFQWGLAYMGTFQVFLSAAGFAVLDASRLLLNSTALLLALAFILATYGLGRELGGARTGLLAAGLVALAPPYLAVHGAWSRLGYMETLLFGSVLLLLALRVTRQTLRDDHERRLFAVLGLVGGLAWWTNPLSAACLLSVGLFVLLRDRQCVRRRGPWIALAFFVLGAAPFWIWNLLHDFGSLRLFKSGDIGNAPTQLVRVMMEGLPGILGARGSHSRTNFVPLLSEAVMLLYAVAFLWLVWRLASCLWKGERVEPGPGLLLLFFGTSALLVSTSRYGEAITVAGTKRYLLPLYSALPLLMALFLVRVRELSRWLFVGLTILPFTLNLYGTVISYRSVKGEIPAFRQARAHDAALFRFLKAHNLTRVYVADYWLAPRLTFDAREEIIFAQPFGDRYPRYTRLVDATARAAYLFAVGTAGQFEALLRGIGSAHERTAIGPYEIFHAFRPPPGVEALQSLPADDWQAQARPTGGDAALAFDRDIDTSWYSGQPQRPGFVFEIDLGRPTRVAKVALLPPRPSIGFPLGYRIEVSRDGRRWDETASVSGAPWSLDWMGTQPRVGAIGRVVSVFEPREVRHLRIQQTGSHPKWNWAIGELFAYVPATASSRGTTLAVERLLDEGWAEERAGRVREAIATYGRAVGLDPELEEPHVRLAALYDKTGVPLAGAVRPAARAQAFERIGLWAKAAREYEKEHDGAMGRLSPHARSGFWRHIARVYREAGDAARAREIQAWLAREFTPPRSAVASFDDQIRLLGYGLEPRRSVAGGTLRVTYYWEALGPVQRDYTVFVHFVRGGVVGFQHDHAPLDGAYPTSRWRDGELIRETFWVAVPQELESGIYDVVLGLWDAETGDRLEVKETALRHRSDRVIVGSLAIGR